MRTALAPADIPGKDRRISERDKLVALSFAILVILLGYALIVEGVSGIVHDDGIYVITAKAIAQGDGYRLIHLPDSPVQTKYPFLYPAILAVIWKLFSSFPGNLLLMQWVSLLSGAATAALAYLYLIRFGYCSRGIAAAAVSLCATSAAFLFLCTTCMSEMPFALCVVLALWALDRHVDASLDSRKAQLLLGMLLALPMLVRINGFVSVLVVLLLALRHKRIMRWPAIGTVMITLPFAVWLLTFTKWSHADSSSAY